MQISVRKYIENIKGIYKNISFKYTGVLHRICGGRHISTVACPVGVNVFTRLRQ